MLINEFMKDMREQFGQFEFRAVSPQGHVVTSRHWPKNPNHPVNQGFGTVYDQLERAEFDIRECEQ